MSSFWLILKQQWTIDEIYIFINSSHLEWRAGLSDTILKGTHPRTIPARFGLISVRGFRGEDLNVKVYDGQTDDRRQVMAKAHMALARWAKKASFSLQKGSSYKIGTTDQRGHSSKKASFSLQKGWPYKRGTTIQDIKIPI